MASKTKTFFRHCPSCGHRFEIRLVGKKLLEDEETPAEATSVQISPMGAWQLGRSNFLSSSGVSMVSLEGTDPVVVDAKKFQYTYRCKHCGHTWMEVSIEESKVGRISGDAVEDAREDSGDVPGRSR